MKTLFIAFLVTLTLIGCQRPPEYPDVPSLEFKEINSFTIYDDFGNISRDSINLKVYFKDGTGDIGLAQNDTSGIYKEVLDQNTTNGVIYRKLNRNSKNYWIDIYIKKNGTFIQMKTEQEYVRDPFSFFIYDGRFRPFTTNYLTNKNPIEGFLEYRFVIYPFLNPSLGLLPEIVPGDTMKFDIRILDRKLNVSNTVTTPEIVVLKPL